MKAALTPLSKLAVGIAAGIGCTICAAHGLRADPLRLRADAIGASSAPVGLLVLRGEDRLRPWLDAEAVAWVGASSTPDVTGDALVLTVRARDLRGRGEVRVGRFVYTAGAIRPLHLDGGRLLARILSTGTAVEVFAGAPVAPRFTARPYDMAWGGRVSQTAFGVLSFGASYLQRHADGRLLSREVGPDLAISPTNWLDFAGRAGFDLGSSSLTDALGSLAVRRGPWRAEAFATRRTAGRLLPATSLFSVLGDVPSTTTGLSLRVQAAPRLDLWATFAALSQGDDLGGYATARATLALDEGHDKTVGVEVRRQSFAAARWSGARLLVHLPFTRAFTTSAELELVGLETPLGPKLLPWALYVLSYRVSQEWSVSGALEFARTRDERTEMHGLARATWSFERIP